MRARSVPARRRPPRHLDDVGLYVRWVDILRTILKLAGLPLRAPAIERDEAIAVVRHHGLQSYLTAATNPNPDRHVETVGIAHLVVTGSRAATPNRSGATWPIWRGSFMVDRGSGRAVP